MKTFSTCVKTEDYHYLIQETRDMTMAQICEANIATFKLIK